MDASQRKNFNNIRHQLQGSLFSVNKNKKEVIIPSQQVDLIQKKEIEHPHSKPSSNEFEEGKKRAEKKRRNSRIMEQIQSIEIQIKKPINVAKTFQEKYTVLSTLGQGAHAMVKKAIINDTGQQVAVKICRSGDPEIVKTFIETYKNQRLLNHTGIVKAYEIYINELSETLYLVMDFTSYPSLQRVLKTAKKLEQELEFKVKKIMQNLLLAIEHCHERGVAHRDIKPDNIMVSEMGDIKIIDFGVSKQFKGFYSNNNISEIHINTKDMWTRTGNYVYCAPEIFEGGGYNEKVDCWAAGVLMHQMLSGYLPFISDSMMDTIELITSSKITFSDEWNNVSRLCKDLLIRLLNPAPNCRLSAECNKKFQRKQKIILDALKHPWFYMEIKKDPLSPPNKSSDDHEVNGKQNSYFERNMYKRSITIFRQVKNTRVVRKPEELNFDNNEDGEEDKDMTGSPLIKLRKMKNQINKEIHIVKKEDQKIGFMRCHLLEQLQRINSKTEELEEENQCD